MTKVRVRIGQYEAEVESDPEHIAEAIELVPLLASKLSSQPKRDDPGQQVPPESQTEGALGVIPAITVEKGDSLADVIAKFFADPWGRERRKLSDVREALQSYGLNYPKQSVAVALLRLAKATKIRRFKADDGEFVYTSSTVASGVVRQFQEQDALKEPEGFESSAGQKSVFS